MVSVYLNSGVLKGLFVVSPNDMADDKEHAMSKFNQYVKTR